MKKNQIRIRTYNVGLGDCFLVTFMDQGSKRNMLIDFGSVPGQSHATFNSIAENIFTETNGHLDVVVVTHDHHDHVCGFLQAREVFDQFTIGYVWMSASCNPQYYDCKTGQKFLKIRGLAKEFLEVQRDSETKLANSFETMLANNFCSEKQLNYVAELPKRKQRVQYLERGDSRARQPFSKDIQVEVLSPMPDIDDYDSCCSTNNGISAIAKRLEAKLSDAKNPKHPIFGCKTFNKVKCVSKPDNLAPRDWRLLRNKNLNFGVQEFRSLDASINNMSLVFMLNIQGKKLLFAGDAQEDAWDWIRYCESCCVSEETNNDCPDCRQIKHNLRSVDFLKLSVHDSSNATAKMVKRLSSDATIVVSSNGSTYGAAQPLVDVDLIAKLRKKHGDRLVETSEHNDKLWVDVFLSTAPKTGSAETVKKKKS